MTRKAWSLVCILVLIVPVATVHAFQRPGAGVAASGAGHVVAAASEAGLRGGGGFGGGGFTPSPSFSAPRPTPRPSPVGGVRPSVRPGGGAGGGARPDAQPDGPQLSGVRPSTLPSGPDTGARPGATPGSGPGLGERPGIANRPGARQPGIAGRPGIDNRLGIGGRPGIDNRPGIANRPNVGNNLGDRTAVVGGGTTINRGDVNSSNIRQGNLAAGRVDPGYGILAPIADTWRGAYGDYHRGWVNGYWHGYHTIPGWNWGSYALSAATGVAAWGLGSSLCGWGYSSHANPYYVAAEPVVVEQPVVVPGVAPTAISATSYDYSQPIDTQAPPPEPRWPTRPRPRSTPPASPSRRATIPALWLAEQALNDLPNDSTLHEFRALCVSLSSVTSRRPSRSTQCSLSAQDGTGPRSSGLYPSMVVYTQQLRALETYIKANRVQDAVAPLRLFGRMSSQVSQFVAFPKSKEGHPMPFRKSTLMDLTGIGQVAEGWGKSSRGGSRMRLVRTSTSMRTTPSRSPEAPPVRWPRAPARNSWKRKPWRWGPNNPVPSLSDSVQSNAILGPSISGARPSNTTNPSAIARLPPGFFFPQRPTLRLTPHTVTSSLP